MTCASGSPKPHVELDHLRSIGGQHQADVKETAKRTALRPPSPRSPARRCRGRFAPRAAHRAPRSAQMRPSHPCSAPCHRRRSACDPAPTPMAVRVAVADDEERDLGTGQTFFDDDAIAGRAKPMLGHERRDGGARRQRDPRRSRRPFRPRDRRPSTRPGTRTSPTRQPSSASLADTHVWKRAVGTRWRAMNALANALLDSRRAAACLGPKMSRRRRQINRRRRG